ncbi:unnamed protein product [Clonostachys rosea f. rosea IK726]|uniref:Calpain catalytic domain-containing protein n=2 Tax=Bionectria ochroleuca TaxID=29856 RepID=A0A0B7KF04_BIOOC|nr:unnamed protein product [Clonostachys rosea f. rosea IK726]
MPESDNQPHPSTRDSKLLGPQDTIDNPHAVKLPNAVYGGQQPPSEVTYVSYDDAVAICRAKVEKIVKECRRINMRYRDPHFDLEADLKLGRRDCLESLPSIQEGKPPGHTFKPQSAKRVVDIFDEPQFFVDAPSANDVKQGRDGDCWLMAALCTLSNKPGLIEKICVAHDQDVGVYGFVFYRDGEWISEIIDDYLYLTKPDYDESYLDRVLFDELERANPEEAYRRVYQSNSSALYFAQCQDPQKTWLPLLEKCYAKAHGDFASIEGGFGGEGIEDLTGGITSELFTSDILDKGELLRVNDEFLFGCSTGVWGLNRSDNKGIVELHAYSVQKAVEIDGERLLRLKNPWGKGEWKGAWSDGSKEWTSEWLQKLGHRFGEDGDFWMTYSDLLRKFQAFERTQLFGPDWGVAQTWTTLTVPWTTSYHDTSFCFTLSKPGPVVIVLSQLDDRYFRGLQGQYHFQLAFRLHKTGHEEYIVRSQSQYRMRRSVNVEVELEQGSYQVRLKIIASRREQVLPLDQVIRNNAKKRRDKLIRVGLAYDLAHGKGKFVELPEEKVAKESRDRTIRQAKREEVKQRILCAREESHYMRRKQLRREKRRAKNKGRMQSRVEKRDNLPASNFDLKVARGMGKVSPADEASKDPRQVSRKEDPVSSEDSESPSDLSGRELDLEIDAHLKESSEPAKEGCPPGPDQEELDEFEKDPWNAVAVVGLRVYYKISDTDDNSQVVKLKVVRPQLLEGVSRDEMEECLKSQGLDIDDSSKDATLEGGIAARKKSIIGEEVRSVRKDQGQP